MKKLRLLPPFILLAAALTACLPLSFSLPTPTTVSSATAAFTETLPPTQTSMPEPTSTPAPTATARPNVARVLIVSVDGMRPDAIALAPMPVLQSLMQTGAYSLTAQTIFPSTTLPAHTSMLDGMCPSKHGITWDTYEPDKGYALGTSLFDLAHASGLRTIMVVGKDKLRQITDPASTDVFQYVNDPDTVVAQRAATLIPQGFGLFFVHLPSPDLEGHAYGWLSSQQLSALRHSDDAIQTLLTALDQAGLRQSTLIIVTADHGGHDTTHGTWQPEDMTIPWIINGPGIQPKQLASAINTTDTAATAAWALGLSQPTEWSGHPVLEAFGLNDPAERPQPRCP